MTPTDTLPTQEDVQVFLCQPDRYPYKAGSIKDSMIKLMVQRGHMTHFMFEETVQSHHTFDRTRISELRREIPEFTEGRWALATDYVENENGGGKHAVYRLVKPGEQLTMFNDPFGARRYRRTGEVA